MPEIIQDIIRKDLQSVYMSGVSFGLGLCLLENEGYRLISLEEQAILRIQGGKDSLVSRLGNWTREGYIHVPESPDPDEKVDSFITKNSPFSNLEYAVSGNPSGEKPISEELRRAALSDSCPLEDVIHIPTLELSKNRAASYAFGKCAEEYGRFLHDSGVRSTRINSFGRQAFFWGLDVSSEIGGQRTEKLGAVRGIRYTDPGTLNMIMELNKIGFLREMIPKKEMQ